MLVMISLEDCFGLCGLDENEVTAISEHEHIPDIAAAALASYLLTQPHGGETVRTMIIDDIHKALDEVVSDTPRSYSWHCGIFSNITPKDVLD
jgi:hypothetical protein